MSRTVYAVKDRRGDLQAYHVRVDTDHGKDVSWLGPDKTPGLNGTSTADLPLYNTHQLDSWADPIIVTEGEKAASALVDEGFHAVATVTGASGTPSDDVLADLEGRAVVLWPDADDVGREHMARVGEHLADRAAVGWIEPPGDVDKGWDAYDAIAESWSIVDVLRGATAFEAEADRYRTLADVSDEPPGPLLLGMLEPAGPTLMYAAPGVGKGTTDAWMCREFQALGLRPVVYDAEQREREWARRVSGIGGARADVVYVTPAELGPKYAGLPLWESIERLGRKVKASGGDVLLVDSILPATRLAEERLRSDAAAPWLYVDALESLGIPSVSFGHPPKGSPEGDPFGSFAWIAALRLTWLDAWLETLTVRERTAQSYRGIVDRYLKPAIGRVPLAKLQPEHVLVMLRDLEQREKPLSPTTIRYVYVVLRIALGRALKRGHVQRNVATLIDPPAKDRSERQPMNVAQARSFLASLAGDPDNEVPPDRLEALYRLAIASGLRQGELLGKTTPGSSPKGRFTLSMWRARRCPSSGHRRQVIGDR